MARFVNVYACLVHESPECVLDLVRNLRGLDPDSTVLLYNGGPDPELLSSLALRRSGVVIHPEPRRMYWGRLHDFALDAMRFALDELDFDTLTIVDSDQLCVRAGYSSVLARVVGGRPRLGMLGNAPGRQTPQTAGGPARTAFAELDQWRPFLERFPGGVDKFVHWTFWPSTVFTAAAASGLVELFDHDRQLAELLSSSKLWATEEVLLPTVTALLGLELDRNPASDAFVRFRHPLTIADLDQALRAADVYWMHPVPRQYDHPLRARIRGQLADHRPPEAVVPREDGCPAPSLLSARSILERMTRIEGWLEEIEGDLLLSSAIEVLRRPDEPRNIVEIGSYCGRSTSVVASAVKALSPESKVWAIDPHDGVVGASDRVLERGPPTLERFRHNMATAGVSDVIEIVRKKSFEVDWDRPIHLLVIDGLHDFENVSRDFHHFERWIERGGLVLFHDYADYYPGVMAFVDWLLDCGEYRRVQLANTLMAVQKVQEGTAARPSGAPHTSRNAASSAGAPLVTCIMPTADRRAVVPKAIDYFQRQDYPNLELIVLDDGDDPVEDLTPDDPRVRYDRLPARLTMGAKQNLACEMATGDIICHWDDDDWMAPWRVSYQVKALLGGPLDAVTGLSTLLFYEPSSKRAWRYVYPAGERPWVSGGTFCYRKRFWSAHPFPDMNEGADTRFIWDLKEPQILAHDNYRFYVATVHEGNTSVRRLHDPRYQSCPVTIVEKLLGADIEFYRDWPLRA